MYKTLFLIRHRYETSLAVIPGHPLLNVSSHRAASRHSSHN